MRRSSEASASQIAWQFSVSPPDEANTAAHSPGSRPAARAASSPAASASFTAVPARRRSVAGSPSGVGTTVFAGVHGARPVLLVAYDCPYPGPLRDARPIADAFAAGLLLAASGEGVRLQAALRPVSPDVLADEGLERIRRGIPAARLLPLLAALARGGRAEVAIEWLGGSSLHVAVAA